MAKPRWNHNIHYYPFIVSSMPESCGLALDVGCGQGLLTREMAAKSQRVIGIDLHEPSLEIAREEGGENIEYLHDDFFAHPFAEESLDFIGSMASLHHLPLTSALERMAKLLRPGGIMCHFGCARPWGLRDFAFDAIAGFFAHRWNIYVLGKRWWEHGSPTASTEDTYREVELTAREILPGSRFRHHVLWRYSLYWVKPIEIIMPEL
jgi:SAM-dependent methyltransferase